MDTRYASPERTSQEMILSLFEELNGVPLIRELLDKSSEIMFVLNRDRQIVFTNRAFVEFLGLKDFKSVLGKRPGEALGCIHSNEVSGCGTTEFCIKCGAVNAILNSQSNDCEAKDECLLNVIGGKSFELMVTAKPFDFAGNRYTFFTASDISENKRKSALERIFFHDIMNLASGIYSVIDLFHEGELSELPPEMVKLLHQSSSDMVKEIAEYRTLLQAEKKELKVLPVLLRSGNVIADVVSLYKSLGDRRGIALIVKGDSADTEFRCDLALINRVLINIVKNALEASKNGDTVMIYAEQQGNRLIFKVNNPAVMNKDIQLQIFKRTFTTKPSGSGLGTYSMKLLGENYLKGEVGFVSKAGEGTTFHISIPLGS